MLHTLACTTCDPALQTLIFDENFLPTFLRVLTPAAAAGLIAAALHRID